MFSKTKNKWLVLVIIAVLAAFVIACGKDETKLVSNDGSGGVGAQPSQDHTESDPPPTDPGFVVVEALAPVESVEILVLESSPEQFVVQVISGLPSGCVIFDRADVAFEGTDIYISVYNMVPAPLQMIACTMIYGIHHENVSLGANFERGVTYSVYVNDQPSEKFTTGATPMTATIENVSIASTRSIPAQHMVAVKIALSGSCETFNSIDWSVEGREVDIEVLTQVPTALVPCTLAIIYEDQSINIGSDFEAGIEYDVIVNGERQGTFFGG